MTQLDIIAGILSREAAMGRLTNVATLKGSKLCNMFRLAWSGNIDDIVNFITIPTCYILHLIQVFTGSILLTKANI
jgi:hypothetical protein